MRCFYSFVLLLFWAAGGCAQSNSYLFVWAGDDAKKSNDFLAVLDADPKSPHYGQAVASVAVPGPSGTPHHTELEMPEGGFLLANAFESGRTMLFDLREPLHPSLVTSFGDLDGYMHPHTYVRLPNGHVLATFQYHGGHEPKSDGGGLVEFDERGHLIRSSSAMDATAKGELIRPYSLVVVPALDRIVSTNTAMHDKDGDSRTVQVWRLSDLKLLRTLVLPPGPRGSEQKFPGEPRLLADGKTVLIHTFSCGLYQLDGVETNQPSVRHLKTFDGKKLRCTAANRPLLGADVVFCTRPRSLRHLRPSPHTRGVAGHLRREAEAALDRRRYGRSPNRAELGRIRRTPPVHCELRSANGCPDARRALPRCGQRPSRVSAWMASLGRTDSMAMPTRTGRCFPVLRLRLRATPQSTRHRAGGGRMKPRDGISGLGGDSPK